MDRVRADGGHLALGGGGFRVKGVTYGTFSARLDGALFPEPHTLKKDLVAIAEAGMNTVRTYTLPPVQLLDMAAELDLKVLVGLHYRDWRYEERLGRAATKRVRAAGLAAVEEAMKLCAGRPEVLAISVGNEVPGDVVRVHGIQTVEETLGELVHAVHEADPGMLATYCNFPTTEFLQVPGQDLLCMNVFLETPHAFRRYVRHLQVAAAERPLLITELGLASEVHGEDEQASALKWQLRILDECGVAGASVFSWTDEWTVAEQAVEGWGFGVTTVDRAPKPALDVLREWSRTTIRDLRREWPRVSVVVCAYNADAYIEACLRSLESCDYPNLEVLVCDDGSSDRTLEIAREFPFRILELEHGGLSRARNAGITASTGEIVAFLDSDAFCHREWPYHLALSLEEEELAATGGPNLAVEDAGLVERAVAQSPGGPIHVLVTDDRAEHVPGCNMAFRKSDLVTIDGFDPAYTAAGDDVDVCWKLLDADRSIGFAPAAQVRHHRRDTLKGYLKQQRGYGRAERMLAQRHTHRFNRLGQARWAGFIYGGPRVLPSVLRPLIYHGYQGTAPYQAVVHRRSEIALTWATALLPLLVLAGLVGLVVAPLWGPGLGVAAVAAAMSLFSGGAVALAAHPSRSEPHPARYRMLVALMHLTQPLVRAWGRVAFRRSHPRAPAPVPEKEWEGGRAAWLADLEQRFASAACLVKIGGPYDGWDLEVSRGALVSQRLTIAVLWDWIPVHRRRWRARPLLWVALAAAAALGLWNGAVPVGGLSGLAALVAVEAFALRRLVRRCLAAAARDQS